MNKYSHLIFHIAEQAAWQKAQHDGYYQAASLVSEGFIHCSTPDQVLRVANRFYQGRNDLTLLIIDPTKVHAPLKYEAPIMGATVQGQNANAITSSQSELFPHIYGQLNLDAVIETKPFSPDSAGKFDTAVSLL